MENLQLLVIEDDPLVIKGIRSAVKDKWDVVASSNFAYDKTKKIHAALVDIHLTGDISKTEGLEVIEKLHSQIPQIEIIAISGNQSRELMEKSLLAGASRFIAKPIRPEELNLTLDKIEAFSSNINVLPLQNRKVHWIGSGECSLPFLKQVSLLKNEKGPVLIEGETGSGKEVVAHILNQQEDGPRPLVKLNISGLSKNLFESELFGHKKGAFTGAHQNQLGLVAAAQDGDLFLDEIEALELSLQAKLLRFIESGEYTPVGSTKKQISRARIIAATNEPLEKLVKKGEFREDLFFRLKGKKLCVPPLRDRKDDFPELIKHLFSLEYRRQLKMDEKAIHLLKTHNWPGNVRELKSICELLIIHAPLPVARAQDVIPFINNQNGSPFDEKNWDLDLNLKEYEKKLIEQALNLFKNIEEVTMNLKISKSKLYRKIKEYEIEWRE